MERESNPMEALCRSGCGFYGNPSTDGLCSVCFKEALKKKQQPPTTTPSPVSAAFVPAPAPTPAPAPAPTPLAAAAPTVPSLPAQGHHNSDSTCPARKIEKSSIMENDPNKKESKGKRLFKKAIRRSSKTNSNGSEQSSRELSVTRSKSFETQQSDDNPDDPAESSRAKRLVEIAEEHNQASDADHPSKLNLDKNDQFLEPQTSKRGVKRKLDEESGAGTSGASTGASDTDADDKDPSKDKKKKNRCAVCRKKVGLTGFECRCGGLFCAVHRYSDKHNCSFDYRELGAQEIRRNNPVVVSQKIDKI